MNQMNPNIESNKLEIQWTELDPILVKVNSSRRKPTATSYRNRITPNESQWNPISSPKTISLLRNRSGTGGVAQEGRTSQKINGRAGVGEARPVLFVLFSWLGSRWWIRLFPFQNQSISTADPLARFVPVTRRASFSRHGTSPLEKKSAEIPSLMRSNFIRKCLILNRRNHSRFWLVTTVAQKNRLPFVWPRTHSSGRKGGTRCVLLCE